MRKRHNLLLSVLHLLRPHQWIKNLFVFTGLIFAHAWHQPGLISHVVLTAIAFCFCSSSVYVYNDIVDRESDRLHPRKKNRPIANYLISLPLAITISILLLCIGLGLGFFVAKTVGLILLAYLVMNIFYTHWWKHVAILDVFVISAGFMLRILAGTTGVGIPPSQWLMFCGLMLTLFLGFAKRRAESFQTSHIAQRAVLKDYPEIFLDKMIGITAACTIISYGLYTMSPQTLVEQGTPNLIYTIPLVAYGIFRYIYLLHHEAAGEDTSRDLMGDKQLLLVVFLWILMVFCLIL